MSVISRFTAAIVGILMVSVSAHAQDWGRYNVAPSRNTGPCPTGQCQIGNCGPNGCTTNRGLPAGNTAPYYQSIPNSSPYGNPYLAGSYDWNTNVQPWNNAAPIRQRYTAPADYRDRFNPLWGGMSNFQQFRNSPFGQMPSDNQRVTLH